MTGPILRDLIATIRADLATHASDCACGGCGERRIVLAALEATTMPDLRMECSWCGALIRDGVEPTSHGICQPCADRERAKSGLKKRSA